MTQQHPITPPSEELVASLIEQAFGPLGPAGLSDKNKLTVAFADFATRAAQWGAHQELEACCHWLAEETPEPYINALRAARRPSPKPPSLKEQALALLDPSLTYGSIRREDEYRISVAKAEIIRRALEQLDD